MQGTESTDNLGDTAAARGSLAKATRLLDEIRRADPKARAPLIMAVDTYGDLALLESDAAAASRADATRLALLGELERRNPTDVDSLMDIADGYSNAGIFRAEHRELDGARRYYGDAVRIYEAIVARSVPRARWTRPYTLALKRLGAVEMVTGALADSERHYRQALALETEQLRADPANPSGRSSGPTRCPTSACWRSARGAATRPSGCGPRRAASAPRRSPTIRRTCGGSTRWRRSRSGWGGSTSMAATLRRRRPCFREEAVAARAAGRRAARPAPAAHRPGVGAGEPRHRPAGPGSAAGPPAAADLAAAREVFRAIDLRPIDVPPSDQDVVELLAAYRTLAAGWGRALGR